DLRFNKIREIPPGTFKGHRNLVSLLLNNNLLTSLKNGAFEGLFHLQHLYLYKNRIKYIEPNVFQGLKKLERLYLHSNELKEFHAGTFSNLPSLDRLNLYNNHLTRIPHGAFENLPKLTRLRLDHNALICDCQIAWLAKMLTDNSLQGSANCKYPSEMYGKSLVGMETRDFHCAPPEIREGPHDVEVSWGGTAIFTCKVQDDPLISIVWMRDEKELFPDEKKYKILDNGSLMIQNTVENDGGYYECMVKSPEGQVKSRPARMVVRQPEYSTQGYGAPRFTVVPESISVAPGAPEVTLRCNAVGVPLPTIEWAKNGIRLPNSYKNAYQPDGSLTIREVDPTDHGNYQCEASNVNGRVIADANVIIKAAPIFTVQPENADTQIGGVIKLECVASGTPGPEIAWFKNDEELQPQGRIHITEDGSVLEIRDAKESDSALYICEASNEMGIREVSAKVKVSNLAFRPPKLIFKPYNIEALIGSTIELPCKAEGDPAPGITWQKDGATMQRTGRFKVSLSGNLHIYKVATEDQGRYECTAINDHGRDSATGYVTVKEAPDPVGVGIGDQFVKIAFAEASEEVDRAINKTVDNLINNKGSHNPADLFRIIRYPDAPARELARAAEIYERTLVNIRKHVQRGRIVMNATSDFNYKEILSPDHLKLIARLSGCMTHRLTRNCSDMCFHSKYRSIDGTCNNLQNPTWGASLTSFRRILKPIYEDGFAKPIGWDKERKYFGYPKPSSRLVSTTLIATSKITPDPEITHMVMQWGQFLDHDLDHAIPSVSSESWDGIDCKKSCDYAAPCYPMDVPPGDPRITNRRCIDFIRSSSICGSGMTSVFFDTIQPREQINQLTSFIDASQVYGFSEELAKDLRDLNTDGGRLREGVVFPGRKPLLPYAGNQGIDCRRNLTESTVNCFVAGDIRVNEQVGLIAMHTLWMREHNRVARELNHLNPHWDSDTLYHEARKIVGSAVQHITYKHWLPYVLGEKGMERLGRYEGYNPALNPSISNVFATAALRFGHTLINPELHRLDWNFKPIREGHLPLSKAFFSPWRVVEEGGIDPLLRGLFTIAAKIKRPDENLNTELTEQLFKTAHAVALDLAAMNIHRSRDHAIPGYVEFRKFCNMSQADSFEDLRHEISDANVRRKLQKLYGHPGNIDVFVGGILEDQIDGGKIGPLFQCLLVEQFRRLRDGDRFFYESPSVFKPEQLVQIKQYSLARVLCDNGDNITRITRNVFELPELQGGYSDCSVVPKVDLKLWSECCSDCRYTGQLNTISRLNARRNRRNIVDESEGFTSRRDPLISNATAVDYQKEMHRMKTHMVKLEKEMKVLRANLKDMVGYIKRLEEDNEL
ncbi:peroxidasin, partial [Anoplophora glabripennis]|uniref:peroxidasin n=1 Tax=Anoplophora glabripennis TaxID=217634 RepID=UPI0008747011